MQVGTIQGEKIKKWKEAENQSRSRLLPETECTAAVVTVLALLEDFKKEKTS